MASLPNAPNIAVIRPDARNQALKFFWSTPTANGSPAVTSYLLTDGGINTVSISSTALFYTYAGLSNGTSYTFRIAASNVNGLGPYSFFRTVQPGLTPGVPTFSTIISTLGSLKCTVGWSNPTDLGGATNLLGTLLTAYPLDSNGNLITTSSLLIQQTVIGGNSNEYQQTPITLTSNYNYKVLIAPIVDAGYGRIQLYTSTISSTTFLPVYDPTSVAGMQLWLDANDTNTIVQVGPRASQWNDKSGNGKNFSNATSNDSPIFDSTLKQLVFSSNALNASSILVSSQRTMNFYAVWSVFSTTGATFQGVFEQNALATSNGYRFMVYGSPFSGRSGNFYGLNGYGTNPTPVNGFPTFTVGSTMVSFAAALSEGTNFKINNRHNGSLYSTQTITQANFNVSSATTRLGRLVGGTTEPFYGNIAEILLYSSIISPADAQTLEGYLAWKWGLSTLLPPTHIFYSRQPAYTDSNMSFSPSSISSQQLWLDASFTTSLLITGVSTVSQWKDLSPLSNNTDTISGTPIVASNYLTSRNAVFFNGTSYLLGPLTNYRSTLTAFVVTALSMSAAQQWSRIFSMGVPGTNDFDSRARVIPFQYSNFSSFITFRQSTLGAYNIPNASTFMGTVTYTGTSSLFFYNASTPAVSTTSGLFSTTRYGLGKDPGNENSRFSGYICELIYYQSSLTLTDRQRVEGYLSWKWGLQTSLPSTHLYYFRPPTRLDTFTAFSPSSIAGLRVWIDATDPSCYVLSGSNVTSTIDKMYGTVFSNASGFVRLANSFNTSYPSFSNASATSGYHLGSNTTITMNQPLTFFAVGKATSTTTMYLFDSPTSSNRVVDYAGPSHIMDAGVGLNGSSNLQSNVVVADHFSTANSFMFQNGAQQATGNVGTNNLLSGLLLCSRYSLTEIWIGNICEMLFFSTAMTAANRQRVEGYLAWKWGLQANLPTTHPFYTGSTVTLGPISTSS